MSGRLSIGVSLILFMAWGDFTYVPFPNELQPLAETDVESGTEWKGGWITNKLSLLGVFNVYTTSGASKHIMIYTTQLLLCY